MSDQLTRRQALQAVGAVAATLYGDPAARAQGKVMTLALDDIARIEVRYRGKVAVVSPADIVGALGAK